MIELTEGSQQKPRFRDGDMIYLLGQPMRLTIIRESNLQQINKLRFELVDLENSSNLAEPINMSKRSYSKVLHVYWPDGLGTPKPTMIRTALVEWYKQYAKKVVTQRVEVWSRKMDLTYNRITIKSQRTRWGSCSTLRNLNFNWRLIMAPLPVLDYVVVHELSHLVEMNHSARFWKLVEMSYPSYRECLDWLKRYGITLFYIDPGRR